MSLHKQILVYAPKPLYDQVTKIAGRLGVGRGAICERATAFVVPRLEKGELVEINGKIVPKRK